MAKKVNKRFLGILTLVVMGVLVAAMGLTRLIGRGDPKEFIARGDRFVEMALQAPGAPDKENPGPEECLKQAKTAYAKARRLDPANKELIVKYGDVLRQLTRFDQNEMRTFVRAWRDALEIDPAYLPALQRVLDTQIEFTELSRTVGAYDDVAQAAKAFIRAKALDKDNPQDFRAEAYEQAAVLGAWLAGKPMAYIRDEALAKSISVIDLSLAQLSELAKQAPLEPDVLWNIARTKDRLAADAASANEREKAIALQGQVMQVFEDALKTQPQNPQILYVYYRALAASPVSARAGDATTRPASATQPATQPAITRRPADLLQQAVSLIKPTDKDYVDINLQWTNVLWQQGKREEADKQLARLLDERPYDQEVRLARANLLERSGKRQEAIELLAKERGDNPDLVGFRAYHIRQQEFQRIVQLATLRISSYHDAAEAERPALRKLIEDGYDRAAGALAAEPPELLILKAKILLLDGDTKSRYEAIRRLQKAYDAFEQRHATSIDSIDLVFLLAQTYASVNETGQARSLVARLVERQPGLLPARRMLVQYLFHECDYAAAEPHVRALEEYLPQDSEVKLYRLALHRVSNQIEQAKQVAMSLPEQTDEQKLLKARALLAAADVDPAVKLLAALSQAELQGDTKSFPATKLLAQIYYEQKKRAEAEKLTDAVLKKIPQDASWKTFAAQVRGGVTSEELQRISEEYIAGIEDEGLRARSRYQYLVRQNKLDEGLAVLVEAEKKTPDDGPIIETIFSHLLNQGRFDQAEPYCQKLAKLDWDQVGGLFYQTHLKFARKDIEGALSGAQDVARRLPEFARSWVLLGRAQEASGQLESAINSYGKAIDKQPDNGSALVGLIRCYKGLGQYDQVRKYVDQGIRLSAPGANFREIALEIDEQIGDLNRVKAVAEQRKKDLEKDPERIGNWLTLAYDYSRLWQLLSKTDPAAAEQYAAQAVSTYRETIKKWPDESTPWIRLAQLLTRTGKSQEGVALVEQLKAREKWKDRPEPCSYLAAFYERMGEEGVGKAEQALMEAIAKSPNPTESRRRLAEFYVRTGQTDKAITLLGELVAATKDLAVRTQLIDVQLTAKKHADAEKSLREALQQNPSDANLLGLLGYVKTVLGDFDAAAEILNQALKINPKSAPAHYYLGMMKLNRGDPAAAVAELEAARDLRSNDADIRITLAEAYQRRSQLNEATRELEAAVQTAPLRTDVRLNLVRFYVSDKRWMAAQRVIDDAKGNSELASDPVWLRTESSVWLAAGDHQKAYDAIVEAYKLAPRDPQVFNDMLDILILVRAYDRVIEVTDGVQRASPQSPMPWWFHMQRGLARRGNNQLALAAEEFERAMSRAEAAPNTADAIGVVAGRLTDAFGASKAAEYFSARKNIHWKIAMARLYLRRSEWVNAAKTLDELLDKDFASLPPLLQLDVLRISGSAYHAAAAVVPGALDKAERCYTRYLAELEKNRADVSLQMETLNNLALLLAEHPTSPNPAKAMLYSSRAYELMDKTNVFNPGVADTQGWVLVLTNKMDEGIALLKRAAERQSLDACYHLGEAYLRKSRPAEALSVLEQAQKMLSDPKIKKTLVDQSLPPRIEAALQKARQMIQPAASTRPQG